MVEKTIGNNEIYKDKSQRLFFSILHQVINKIDVRSSHQNVKPYAAVSALQPENSNFLKVKMGQPLLDLLDGTSVEAEFDVAKTCIAKFNDKEKTKPTTTKLLSEDCEALKAMPIVHLDLKLGITFEASAAKFENSFSVLKIIMRDRKQSMTHACKAYLAQLAFESDSPKNLKTDWKKKRLSTVHYLKS